MGKDDSVQSEESCFVFPVSLTILSSFKEIITIIHWDKVSNFSFYLSPIIGACHSHSRTSWEPKWTIASSSLCQRGWVSLTMLKLIANFGGSKCSPAGNHGWRDRMYISVQSPAYECRSVTFSCSKLDIHKFTAARCTLLFWSMESIDTREGVEGGFLKKGVFFTMERNR